MPKAIARSTLILVVLILAPWGAWAFPYYSRIFVLGDSLSDDGNAAIATIAAGGALATPPFTPVPSAPYAISGRLSNGPVWTEYLAAALGNSLAPSLSGGTDFAFGGARVVQVPGVQVPSLQAQYAQLLPRPGARLPSDALYIVWGGSNDTRDALAKKDPGLLQTAVDGLTSIIGGLALAGATDFLIPNVPDLGLSPEARSAGAAAQAAATAFSALFDSELDAAIGDIVENSPGISIDTLDVFSLLRQLVANPGAYGFADAVDPCLTFGVSDPDRAYCSDPDSRFFWDGIHPTTRGHAALAAAALAEIPEPATLALLALGLGGVGLRRRRALPAV